MFPILPLYIMIVSIFFCIIPIYSLYYPYILEWFPAPFLLSPTLGKPSINCSLTKCPSRRDFLRAALPVSANAPLLNQGMVGGEGYRRGYIGDV